MINLSEKLSKIRQKFHVLTPFPVTVLLMLLAFILLYHFSYFFPFTNNAFVVANVRPVAADVEGYITDLYIKNEQYVKKGQPLFTVFKRPYELAYQKAIADVKEAKAEKMTLMRLVEKTQSLLQAKQAVYQKVAFDYERYRGALKDHAVSEITVQNLLKERNAMLAEVSALTKDLKLNQQKIITQQMKIKSLEAVRDNAKVNLDETTVYAKNNGIVQNMFVSVGTPIKLLAPVFSFIDTDDMYIQANFNETDLRDVKPGSEVSIYPRMYWGAKTYHGIVVSRNWAANRQLTDMRSQVQQVNNNASNWLLLPQRLPVQIKIIDYDPIHYPLNIGASAYVYIHV